MVLRFDPTNYKRHGFYTARNLIDSVPFLPHGEYFRRQHEQLEALGRSMTEEQWRKNESTADYTAQLFY